MNFFNVWPRKKINWAKNSKFRLNTFFCRFILHILPNFDDDRMKTLGGVRENVQNMLILTIRLTPVTLTLFGRSRSYYPDAPISYANISMKFHEDWMMGKGQKGCDGRPDGRTAGRTDKTVPISAKWQIKKKNSLPNLLKGKLYRTRAHTRKIRLSIKCHLVSWVIRVKHSLKYIVGCAETDSISKDTYVTRNTSRDTSNYTSQYFL